MQFTPKPINEQVLVIAGASSGIGLVTAKTAAARDARVVLTARNEKDLAHAVAAIRERGGRAVYQVCDVADPAQVDALAERAIAEFGGFDTWVNNAAVSIYGRSTEISLPDLRRQFDVNYWGTVHGMLTAVRHLRAKGGVIINVASAVADRAIPLQGNYSATKQAIKAFTDTLRMELEEEDVPIAISLVKPGSIDTPLFEKAKTLLGVEPQPIPPVYAPDVVADAILEMAQRPKRDLIVGGMGKVMSVGEKISPRLTDKYMERSTFDAQKTQIEALADRPNNLYEPVDHDGGERGHFQGRVKKWSAYTETVLHPRAAAGIIVGLGVAVTTVVRKLRGRKDAGGNAENITP
jgi:NAD(P)-dependent dehydrogenase (short-subunit alcohol dehydrogenase family)